MASACYKNAAKRTTGHLVIVLCICLLGSLNRCSSPGEPVAGGTSIPNQIAGIIRDTTGTPACGAKVKLIDILSPGLLLPRAVDSTQTGSLGNYRFTNIKEGKYAIEAVLEGSMVLFSEDVDVGRNDTIDVSGKLATGGTITGSVAIPGKVDVILHIANSHYRAVPDASGAFRITGLQPGTHVLLTIVHDAVTGNSAIVRCDSVIVGSDAPEDVGTLEPQSLHNVNGDVMVDDFGDGDNITVQGQYWWMFDDRYDGGNSHIVPFNSDSMVEPSGGGGSNFSAHCTFSFGDVAKPRHIGIGFAFGGSYREIPRTFDLSRLKKIHFRAKGGGCDLLADVRPALFNYTGGINIQSNPVTADWTGYVVDIESLIANDAEAAQSLYYCDRFVFVATGEAHLSGELWIDDVLFGY